MRLLTGRLLVMLGLLFAAVPAAAQDAEIRSVITRQLDAFRRDDWAEAFTYASPALQKIFATPERFRDMVLGGYRAVYRPRQVSFRELDLSGPRPVQIVFFIGPDGLAYLAAYEMEPQQDGTWRIASVQLIRAAAKAV